MKMSWLSNCTTVKVTPSANNIISVSNPTGVIPKLVHITSGSTSHARTTLGYVLEGWFTPDFGTVISTYTGGDDGIEHYTPVSETPTQARNYQISTSAISAYRSGAATGFMWDTSTEYTIEIYT